MRRHLRAAIEQHEKLIGQFEANQPDVPVHAVGEGFTAHTAELAAAMGGVHQKTVHFLRNRVEAWQQILSLVDAIDNHDSVNAAELGGRGTR